MAKPEQKEAYDRVAGDVAWKMTCRRLQSKLPETVFHRWTDNFQLTELTKDRAVFAFHENESSAAFLKEYAQVVSESMSWAVGRNVEVEFCPLKQQITNNKKQKRPQAGKTRRKTQRKTGERTKKAGNRWRALGKLVLGTVICLVSVMGLVLVGSVRKNQSFTETFYQLGSHKVPHGLRIIQLSDLHNTEFGEQNESLVRRVSMLEPDIIVMTGDMIDRRDASMDVAVELCEKLAKIAPSYYIYGNNETAKVFRSEDMMLESVDALLGCPEDERNPEKFYELDDELRKRLEDSGVQVLLNRCATVTVGEAKVDLFGVVTSSAGAFWEYTRDPFAKFRNENPEHLKVFLCHEPTLFEVYGSELWGDINLCGHTHGGVANVPHMGALYISSMGKPVMFPERKGHYVAGMKELNGYPLIVNRGLTNRGIVRVNNQPELVVIDVNRY